MTMNHKIKLQIPDKCVKHIKNALSTFNGPKTTKGYERALNITKNPNIIVLKNVMYEFKNRYKNPNAMPPIIMLRKSWLCLNDR